MRELALLAILPTKQIHCEVSIINKKALARFEAKATVIKAMAHPTRILIIDALSQSEHCVCELTAMIGADTSTVSKHLTILKNAGIVMDEKRNQMVFYTLSMPCVLGFLSCIEVALQDRAKAQLAIIK